jgi:hypothetical protein
MRPFRRERDGSVRAVFSREEADVIVGLAAESAQLAESAREDGGVADPALQRLLPDAYPDDATASAEFRRFTTDGLAERKVLNARTVMESLAHGSSGRVEVQLDEAGTAAWLRTITDVRLVLGARLGIVRDGDAGDVHDDESAYRRAVYDWLAYVQETLVLALGRR